MSVLTLVYVIATIFLLRANFISVNEMKKTREEENRPYVIVYFESKANGPINLIVKNIGKTIAQDTSIKIETSLDYPKSRPLGESNLLNKPIPSIPPGYQYKAYVGMGPDIKRIDTEYPVYNAKVIYHGQNLQTTYNVEYILDLNFQRGLLSLKERDINDLAKDFNEYQKESKKQLISISSSLKNISIKK